jgi:hypothetical protein
MLIFDEIVYDPVACTSRLEAVPAPDLFYVRLFVHNTESSGAYSRSPISLSPSPQSTQSPVVRPRDRHFPQSCKHSTRLNLSLRIQHRFRYADDICLYRASPTLSENVELLSQDVQAIVGWGTDSRVHFAPKNSKRYTSPARRDLHHPVAPGRHRT